MSKILLTDGLLGEKKKKKKRVEMEVGIFEFLCLTFAFVDSSPSCVVFRLQKFFNQINTTSLRI